ncbi:phage tail length tape measure family protein, partial [Escherichia coli]|nr:phage tail length tape measure family protein [Escherichia coli]
MDQIANLVIDLGIDAAEFKNEIPRIKNLLNGAASDAERSSARMQRFMERQTQAARQTTQAASSAATAASVHAQTVEKNAQAHERMAREVEKTRQRMEALSQKMRDEQAQAMALAEAQDKAAAAFYRQIDSVKQASAGLQELQRIQQQIRQARNSGGIGQQDYLALISEVTAKTRVLTQAEEEATRQKVAFIRQLKEQATRQNLSSSELLRAKAAQLGVSSAAEVYIRKMEQAGKATHSLGLKSAAARQEIGVLIGELARGNLGALRGSGITLANRAGWIDTLMSPKGMMLGGVIGGIAAAVYGLGKAWYDGQKEGEEFNRQLSLTGHYAGVTAVQHVPEKEAIVDNGAHFDGDQSGTVNGVTPPAVQHLTAEVTADSGEYQVLARWDTPKVVKGVSFMLRLTVAADDGSERLVSTARTTETTYRFTQLALGNYRLTVRAVNAWGQQGDPASVSFRIAAPAVPSRIELTPGYFQITATPHLAVYDPTVQFEFWFSEKRITDIRQVETTARYLGTALYWIAASINIKPGHDYYFYVRSVNTVGKSAFVEAVGQPSDDASGYLDFFKGEIGKTHLAQELWTQIDNGQLAPDLAEIRTSITDVSNEITQTVNKKLEDQSAAIQQIQKVQVDTNNNLNSMWAVK